LVTWNRRSLGVSFRTHISSCPRCTVSFSVPVFAEISNAAGRSRDANSAASGLALPGWFGCAWAGNPTRVESPTSAATRARLFAIPVPLQPRDRSPIDQRAPTPATYCGLSADLMDHCRSSVGPAVPAVNHPRRNDDPRDSCCISIGPLRRLRRCRHRVFGSAFARKAYTRPARRHCRLAPRGRSNICDCRRGPHLRLPTFAADLPPCHLKVCFLLSSNPRPGSSA
jgi:hypothetical protein